MGARREEKRDNKGSGCRAIQIRVPEKEKKGVIN